MENSQQSRQDAQRIIDYLRQRGYNTQQETAARSEERRGG